MTNNSTAVTLDNLPAISHAGRPVVTTALLAKLYGADIKNIQNNHARNADRFEPGKHFFKVEGADLAELKNRPSLRGSVASKARSLILWTERGAARHAKMLDTDEAWEVFEKLEDSYFGKAPVLAIEHKPETLSPAHQRHILNRVAELAGMDRKKYPAVWRGIKDHFQVGSYKDIPDSQYPAVCEFMLCRPMDGDIPTAKPIEKEDTKVNWPAARWLEESDPSTRRRMTEFQGRGNMMLAPDMLYGRDSMSPSFMAIAELEKAGHNLEACRFEVKALKHHLEGAHYTIESLRMLIERSGGKGIRFPMADPGRAAVA